MITLKSSEVFFHCGINNLVQTAPDLGRGAGRIRACFSWRGRGASDEKRKREEEGEATSYRFGFHSCSARAAAPRAPLKLPKSESTTNGASWCNSEQNWATALRTGPSKASPSETNGPARIIFSGLNRESIWQTTHPRVWATLSKTAVTAGSPARAACAISSR